ncbi:hypothetical protein BFJ67_g16677 [Fusarium oxysporum f. sp. cepae]|nr:hypothetical protein BFJ67_g16677 [Fusarium oxysporum f. sp. cepae]
MSDKDLLNAAHNSVAYINGWVYTVNKTLPWVEAFIVDTNGIFSAVGNTREIVAAAKAASMVVYDLKGRFIMPGIHDAHVHTIVSGSGLLNLAQTGYDVTRDNVVERIKKAHALAPTVMFTKIGYLEVLVLGSRILVAVSSTKVTRIPLLSSWGQAYVKRVVKRAIAEMHRHGVTSCQDASSTEMFLAALSELEAEGKLKMQFATHCLYKNEWLTGEIQVPADKLILNADKYQSRHVDTRFVKMMMDGAYTPALMSHSDVDDNGIPDQSKILLPDAAELVERFDGRGMTCKIHCMGYGGARTALDAFEIVRQMRPDGPRHEVAHCTRVLPGWLYFSKSQRHSFWLLTCNVIARGL